MADWRRNLAENFVERGLVASIGCLPSSFDLTARRPDEAKGALSVSASTHRAGVPEGAHESRVAVRPLGAVNDVNLPAFLIADPLRGQSFDNMHRSFAARTTPDGVLAGGSGMCGGWLLVRE